MPLKDKKARSEYHREYMRSYYKKNAQKQIRRARVREDVIRAFLNATKEAFPCECGESDIACLDFHHPAGKEICLAHAARNGWSIDRIVTELCMCVAICSNCHRKLHARLGTTGRVDLLRGSEMVTRLAHNQEIAGPIPAPATRQSTELEAR